LNNLKSFGGRVMVFSDDKTFSVDPVFNKQNDRFVSFSGDDRVGLFHTSTTKHPASLMMLGVVASNGKVMPPIWFPEGYRLTGNDYKKVLDEKVLPWIREVCDDRAYVFQQDGAPAHTSNVVQTWMGEEMTLWDKTFWPSQSPDLYPLDYAIWARVEHEACSKRHMSTGSLKTSVNEVWGNLPEDYVRKVCAGFRPRLEKVISCNGGYID